MSAELSNLNVYYGWSIMNKIRRKPSLSVIFENEGGISERRTKSVKRLQSTCYIRKQTIDEAKDSKFQNRVLTEYSLFLNQKPFNGSVESLLESNYQADINNVSADVLQEIKSALYKSFKQSYFKGYKP